MSTVELGQEIQLAHETNPLLEFGDELETFDQERITGEELKSQETKGGDGEINDDNRYSAENEDILPFQSPALPGTSRDEESNHAGQTSPAPAAARKVPGPRATDNERRPHQVLVRIYDRLVLPSYNAQRFEKT